jgi:hypothetical protein
VNSDILEHLFFFSLCLDTIISLPLHVSYVLCYTTSYNQDELNNLFGSLLKGRRRRNA